MDKFKGWLFETGFKVFGPAAIRGAILGLSGWFMVRSNVFEQIGIISDKQAHVTIINWDQLAIGLIALIPALLAGVIKLTHVEAKKTIEDTLGK